MVGMTKLKPVILVVDDVAVNLRIINSILCSKYLVKGSTDGIRALDVAMQPPGADLILLDLHMPGVDGYSVLKQLKANPLTDQIPVVFMSAKSDSLTIERCLNAGAVDYLIKPVMPDGLFECIERHLRF